MSYLVFGADTVRKSIIRLPLSSTAQTNMIIAVSEPLLVQCTVNSCCRTDTVPSNYELYKSLERSLRIYESSPRGSPHTYHLLHARVLWLCFESCIWARLRHRNTVLQPDTAPHETEKTKGRTVPRGGGNRIPLTAQISIHRIVLYHVADMPNTVYQDDTEEVI